MFYHVYSASVTEDESCLMQLAYVTPGFQLAVRAAGILFSGRPVRLLPGAAGRPRAAPPAGVITGAPVWVRNKPDHGIVVMITEHPSEAAADAALTAVRLSWQAPARARVPVITAGAEAAAAAGQQ
jgi:hypothetical protein